MPFVPSTITLYGGAHTLLSLVPVLIGLFLYLTRGTIDLRGAWGKAYWVLALIGTVTGGTIFHHGGFGPGHAVSIAMGVVLLAAGLVSWIVRPKTRTLEIILVSLSYFFLWFFTTTETLTRVPVAHPFAPSPEALQLAPVRVVLLIVLVAGIWLQLRAEKKTKAV